MDTAERNESKMPIGPRWRRYMMGEPRDKKKSSGGDDDITPDEPTYYRSLEGEVPDVETPFRVKKHKSKKQEV